MATTKTVKVNLELGQESTGLLRYYADGKRTNCPALVALQRSVLEGEVPKKLTMTLAFLGGPVEEPADNAPAGDTAVTPRAAAGKPKPKRSRARAQA